MKKLNMKGFTLAELLIVVAIIAVLVAISIPVFNTQLEKSREQTDIANIRAAKAIALVGVMDGKVEIDGKLVSIAYGAGSAPTASYYYDAAKGVLVETKPSVGYGKGTGANGGCQKVPYGTTSKAGSYTKSTDCRDQVLKCVFKKSDSTYKLAWD